MGLGYMRPLFKMRGREAEEKLYRRHGWLMGFQVSFHPRQSEREAWHWESPSQIGGRPARMSMSTLTVRIESVGHLLSDAQHWPEIPPQTALRASYPTHTPSGACTL